jgi:hypothetical protein
MIETDAKEINIGVEVEPHKDEQFRERSSGIMLLYGETIQLYGINIHYERIG